MIPHDCLRPGPWSQAAGRPRRSPKSAHVREAKKSKLSGLSSPRRFRFSDAWRPNSIRRILSGRQKRRSFRDDRRESLSPGRGLPPRQLHQRASLPETGTDNMSGYSRSPELGVQTSSNRNHRGGAHGLQRDPMISLIGVPRPSLLRACRTLSLSTVGTRARVPRSHRIKVRKRRTAYGVGIVPATGEVRALSTPPATADTS
jgi:hypothetical protein